MIWIYILSLIFVFLYSWGGNTNGSKSPQIMMIGAVGFLLMLIASLWISYQSGLFVWINVLWPSILAWIILSLIFQKLFKHSWVDDRLPSQREIKKIVKNLTEKN